MARAKEGTTRGYLSLRTTDGRFLAIGDLTQTVRGNRVESRTIFRFKDGSIDDETTVFSQQDNLRLISDHHIQKGPAFPRATDVTISMSTGEVTIRSSDDKQKDKVVTERMQLPSDLANGMLLSILKNVPADVTEMKVSYLAATDKPRLVKQVIRAAGQDAFLVSGYHRSSRRFVVKIDLGGITGVVAPILGKQPEDTNVWISEGQASAFLKLEGPLYGEGPVWSVQPVLPAWPKQP